MKKKLVLTLSLLTLTSFTLGAATGTKITAYLKNMPIVCNGQTSSKEVISYNNSTYVPLRSFGDMTGVTIDYKNGTIYVGEKAPEGSTPAPVSTTPTTTVAASGTYDYNNPAPIGTAQSFSFDDDSDVTVCIESVERGAAAWSKIAKASEFNEAAPAGQEYLLVKIKFTNNSSEEKMFSTYNYDSIGPNFEVYDMSFQMPPAPSIMEDVAPGKSREGYAVFVVDKSDKTPKLGYGYYSEDSGVWFKLY